MGEQKDAFQFNLPPLPPNQQQPGSAEGKTSGTIEGKNSKPGMSRNEPEHSPPSKAPPYLLTFSILIAITWLLFFGCLAGIIIVLIEYKNDRDELKAAQNKKHF
ncbi:hypothetical protein V3C99_007009 [Haemonchus contortus]